MGIKSWIRKRMGLQSYSEAWAETGEMTARGFAEGLSHCINDVTREDDERMDEITRGMEQVAGIIRDHQEDGQKEGVDKTDTSKNVHDVRTKVDHTNWGKSSRDNHTIIDPLFESFERTVWDQQEKVLASGKYEHPVHRSNHTAVEWSDHQMDEFADALVYHQALRQTIDEAIKTVELAQRLNQAQVPSNTRDRVDVLLRTALDRLR